MRYEVRLWHSPLVIDDAENDNDARRQAFEAIAESPDLLDVLAFPPESELPSADEVRGILAQPEAAE